MSLAQQSNAAWMPGEMARSNEDLEAPFRGFLDAVVRDKRQHVRFLNLLSLLEHIGSRKIMLSQMNGNLTQDVLKHLAEETRHAFFFKRQAEKLCGRKLNDYACEDTMGGAAGRRYFERLDLKLIRGLSGGSAPETGYLWVSLVVELRAIWVYNLYQAVLVAAGAPLSLKGIVAEEDRHLEEMAACLDEAGFDTLKKVQEAIQVEKALFIALMKALSGEMDNGPERRIERSIA